MPMFPLSKGVYDTIKLTGIGLTPLVIKLFKR